LLVGAPIDPRLLAGSIDESSMGSRAFFRERVQQLDRAVARLRERRS
jgi:hypothetical protein